MIKNFLSILLIVSLLSTTACKKDSTKDKLSGNWTIQEISQDEENVLEDIEEGGTIEAGMDFDEDGDWNFSIRATYDYEEGLSYCTHFETPGTWELQNEDQLIIKATNDGTDIFTETPFDIIELTNNKLEISGMNMDSTTVVIKASK